MTWIRRLFGKRAAKKTTSKDAQLADTAPLEPGFQLAEEAAPYRRYFAAGSAQSKGLEREVNEDSLLTLFGKAFGEDELEGFGLFCIADGAGGQGNGMVASSLAIKAAAHQLVKGAILQILQFEFNDDLSILKELFEESFEKANAKVRAKGEGGVTTLTAAMVYNDQMLIGHVGDSRAYTIQDNSCQLLTRDHSFPWRLVEIGQLTAEEAKEHPKRNLLWNTVGQSEDLSVDVNTHPIPKGGYLLLCSDGLWGQVEEDRIVEILSNGDDLNETCDRLVKEANAAGGPDNISAILVRFPAG